MTRSPLRYTKREPLTLAARSMSMMSSARPRSRWSLGSKSNSRGVPTVRRTTESSSPPSGTSGSARLGSSRSMTPRRSSVSASAASCSLIWSPSARMAAIAWSASPPAFLTAAISSLARLRSARRLSTSVSSCRRRSSTARNSSSDDVESPRRCRALRTSSGLARTIFTSSIVSPRGRVDRPSHGIAPPQSGARGASRARAARATLPVLSDLTRRSVRGGSRSMRHSQSAIVPILVPSRSPARCGGLPAGGRRAGVRLVVVAAAGGRFVRRRRRRSGRFAGGRPRLQRGAASPAAAAATEPAPGVLTASSPRPQSCSATP